MLWRMFALFLERWMNPMKLSVESVASEVGSRTERCSDFIVGIHFYFLLQQYIMKRYLHQFCLRFCNPCLLGQIW
jgi:hypothetical protein